MAVANIYGAASGNVLSPSGADVWVKAAWSDDWTFVPFLSVKYCEECAAPSIGQAEFEYNFGWVSRAETGYGCGYLNSALSYFDYLWVNGGYVQIWAWNSFSYFPIWTGIIQSETIRPFGGNVPMGCQAFTAYELKHFLDRVEVDGSATEDTERTAWWWIDEVLTFNRRADFGLNVIGNRSLGVAPDDAYVFSSDGYVWSSFDILNYLVVRFANNGDIVWKVAGPALVALSGFYNEYCPQNRTLFQIFNDLIPRQRGIGWTVIVDGNTAYIYVFSLLPFDIALPDLNIPANNSQTIVVSTDTPLIDAQITESYLDAYDTVLVKGGHVWSMANFSPADETLVPGWTWEQELVYREALGSDADENDLGRKADAYAAVYQNYIVPADWDGYTGDGLGADGSGMRYNALPAFDYFGNGSISNLAKYFRASIRFSRQIPIMVESTKGSGYGEYLPMICALYIGGQWVFAENADAIDQPTCRVSPMDSDFGVQVVPSKINHVLALNFFDWSDPEATPPIEPSNPSNTDPVYDHSKMIIAGFFKTNEQIKVLAIGDLSFIGRSKVINLPDAEVWVIVPQTVVDIVGGVLQRYAGTDLWVVRDDTARVFLAAALAATWYGYPRALLQLEKHYVSVADLVGDFVLGYYDAAGYSPINTPVTTTRWDFSGGYGKTISATGYEELQFEGIV